eukprot:jgi/Ulvmu1/11044/UM007_0226.1
MGGESSDQLLPASAPPLQAVTDRSPLESNGFSSGLFGCFDDANTCCISFCCPCHAHGLICHDISGEYWIHCLSWLVCASCPPEGLHPLLFLGTFTRIRLRDKYGLRGSVLEDVLVHLCCHCCATAQELRHVEHAGRLQLTVSRGMPVPHMGTYEASRV